ncbi:MAG: cation-translocating P-type ATPase [Candidatus Bathyarchaeia archaeon]
MKQKAWHSMDTQEVLSNLDTSLNGLTENEARLRLQKFGLNEIVTEKRPHPFMMLLNQFRNVLIIILIFATIFSAAIGEFIDAAVILAIVFASAGLGFTQEYRAERALEALKKMLSPNITVVRDGKERDVASNELVPGDIVLFEAGDKVPADARLLEMANLKVDEAPLTGESVPVSKELAPLPTETYLADRKNMLFSGTTITYGRGKAVVTATGMSTEFGRIAKEVTASTSKKTPLEKRTENIGKWLGILSLTVCLSVAVLGILREYVLEGVLTTEFLLGMVMFGVALAVAAVPESLPAVVTGTLAIGMHEMAKRNALVRKMSAVETLGCTTVICSDKTGTLTKGEMTVRRLYLDGQTFEVTGVGYEPKGIFKVGGKQLESFSDTFSLFMLASILCNDATLEEIEGRWQIRGDPTEAAMIVAAEKAGYHQEDCILAYPRIGELPFSSERKRMSTVHSKPESEKRILFMKGAPEVVLEKCTFIRENGRAEELTEGRRETILGVNEMMAAEALRVLGVAYRELPENVIDISEEVAERDLIFLGLAGMIDPPREEAIEAVKISKQVGIKPVMVSGDHKSTSVAIAREIGIFEDGDIALTGDELEKIDSDELERIVTRITVYARVSPIHKLKIVDAWKRRGEIVAVTGDGVNDAPAVKCADIGVAMGITGTEVTKEASDIVLADDNFATIVRAIEQGRRILDNVKKYLTYLLQCNVIEVLVVGGGVLAGLPLPLLPAQILWVNLVTDGAPALALGISPPDPDVMKRPPRNPKETLLDKEVKTTLTVIPLTLSPLLLLIFIEDLAFGVEEARTTLFLVFVFFELMVALNCRSLTHSIFKVKPHTLLILAVLSSAAPTLAILLIPQVRIAFGMVIPSFIDILYAAGLSILPLILFEASKAMLAKRKATGQRST